MYRLELSRRAEKALRWLAQNENILFKRVSIVLDDLELDPFQGKALKGELAGRYSYRVGRYRIIYMVRRHELLVLVIDIGHRREVYR